MRAIESATSLTPTEATLKRRQRLALWANIAVPAVISLTPLPLDPEERLIASIYALALVGFIATEIPDELVALSAAHHPR